MTVIVITGGIASGKSTAAGFFRELGVSVIDTDDLARELVQPGSVGLRRIQQHFGADVIGANGQLDRGKLRQIIFADSRQQQTLERILHPRIERLARSRTRQALSRSVLPYVLLEVPLYAETGGFPWVDRVLLIDTDEATQLQRLQRRDAISTEQAQAALTAQASRQQHLECANDSISNQQGLEALRTAVSDQHRAYLKRYATAAAT